MVALEGGLGGGGLKFPPELGGSYKKADIENLLILVPQGKNLTWPLYEVSQKYLRTT